MKKQFSGALNVYMEPRMIGPLMTEEQKQEKLADWYNSDTKNLDLLCDHFGIAKDVNQYFFLSLALAQQMVPCFMVKAKEGAPKKWGVYELGILAVEIERLLEAGKNLKESAKELSTREPWKSFVGAWDEARTTTGSAPDEALITQYKKAKKDKWTSMFRDAFKHHETESTISKWDDEVLKLKGNN